MEMPAQGGHDKSSMKRSGHAVSHKCLASTRHGGESGAKKELVLCTRAERTRREPEVTRIDESSKARAERRRSFSIKSKRSGYSVSRR